MLIEFFKFCITQTDLFTWGRATVASNSSENYTSCFLIKSTLISTDNYQANMIHIKNLNANNNLPCGFRIIYSVLKINLCCDIVRTCCIFFEINDNVTITTITSHFISPNINFNSVSEYSVLVSFWKIW